MSEQGETAIRLVFDFALRDGEEPTRLAFSDPVVVYAAYRVEDVPFVLQAVQKATTADGLWAAGSVSYEAAPAFDTAFVTNAPYSGLPLAWFGVFAEARKAERPPTPHEGGNPIKAWLSADSFRFPPSWGVGGQKQRTAWNHSIAAIHEAIARGETYQVNLTRRLRTALPTDFDMLAFYEPLRAAQQGTRYAAFLDTGRFHILSTSPELFFATQGQDIITRPMKGTAPRGRWNEEDILFAESLAASEKERAENVMIVDLLRNDLGKIAAIGSVKVPDLFTIERYPTVFQMTSTVQAKLRDGIGLPEIFKALFPCGSITGAPKVSTMRHIAVLENEPRGVYCGAVGLVQPGGDAVFNVAIRTLVRDRETGSTEYGVGGGITWDSEASREWEETEMKARVLSKASPKQDFDLLETLRLEEGIYYLYERHLTRLTDSAAYFQRRVDKNVVSAALERFAKEHSKGIWRVRLLVAKEGIPWVEGVPFSFQFTEPLPVLLAETPIDSRNVFLFHKTTRREIYEGHRQALPEGIYDSLLWNENGEVTEFTSANIVAEINGVRWTPPRASGLLAGTFRAELLENKKIQERILTIGETISASRLWLINSVRGWIPVRLGERQTS